MVEKLVKTNDSNVVYLEIKFGEFEIVNVNDIPQLENKIIQKVQYVYTDYPKDFDYFELNFKRFASLFVEFKSVFNKPWVEWEIIKQTKCYNLNDANKLFHGFIITFKDCPTPNIQIPIPPEIQAQLDEIKSSVEFTDIKSSYDLTKFLSTKEIKVSNFRYQEYSKTIKLFEQNDPGSFDILKGLFLTTGTAEGAIGPNNSPSVSGINYLKLTQDKNLKDVLGGSPLLFDASIVEFDIQIDADSLVFKYAFASEEYPEFLNYNDVFGLFISGPGLNNFKQDTLLNLAKLPDKKTPISVSSINHLTNKEYYIPNDYKNLKLFKAWQFDGYTKVLTARVKVKPKQKYHIKLAIADFGDPYYDSAIFIDAFGIKSKPNSFSGN